MSHSLQVTHLDSDSPEGKAIGETRGKILKSKYLPTLRAFPQVREPLTRLHEDGLKLLVAKTVIMLGDTPHDVQAAQKAGIKILGIHCGVWAALDLHGAQSVYSAPAELLAHYGNWATD